MSELVRDWKAEKKDLEEAFDIIADKLVKADAEIERLKQSKNILSDLLYKMEAKANRHEVLITELCDALGTCNPGWPEYHKELIQRGREAAR